eukprot:symbB.v1.2.006419.t1/scaffold383.1/size215797/1
MVVLRVASAGSGFGAARHAQGRWLELPSRSHWLGWASHRFDSHCEFGVHLWTCRCLHREDFENFEGHPVGQKCATCKLVCIDWFLGPCWDRRLVRCVEQWLLSWLQLLDLGLCL